MAVADTAKAATDTAVKAGGTAFRAVKGILTSKWTWGILGVVTLSCAMANPLGATAAFSKMTAATGMGDVVTSTASVVPSIISSGYQPATAALANTTTFAASKLSAGASWLGAKTAAAGGAAAAAPAAGAAAAPVAEAASILSPGPFAAYG